MRLRPVFLLTVVSCLIACGGRSPGGAPAPDPARAAELAAVAFAASAGPRTLYLDLVKRTVTDLIYEDDSRIIAARRQGLDWPTRAHTMIGSARLDNLHLLMEDVLGRRVPGDFIECGAWRGGATIFMRAVLKAHGVTDRAVWVADSFEGLPPPDERRFPADKGDRLHEFDYLGVTVEKVQENFRRYDLLDGQVRFLKGWFKDTLPTAPIERLAVLRIDADMYESTMDALKPLYPKLAVGGYVVIDDAGAVPACLKAVVDYRTEHGIDAEVKQIDYTGVYWKKESN